MDEIKDFFSPSEECKVVKGWTEERGAKRKLFDKTQSKKELRLYPSPGKLVGHRGYVESERR